ncbi:MAG TPA: ABC transporter ATP-binding protein, partial [Anaerolineae bacterium]|nr:ABC transporter ATP-binding protein [Anaerolineae bacterium]
TRTALQDELLRLQRQLRKTILFVTHDVEEALRLADRIVVMREGRVVQYDSPVALLTRPADAFVSHLLGADDMVRQLGLIRVDAAMSPLTLPPDELAAAPAIPAAADLRQALSLLLRTGATALKVTSGGAFVGQLTLERIRAAAQE